MTGLLVQDLLRIEHLTKTFTTGFIGRGRKIIAVDDVNFYCKPGEVMGIIGESGSGKTTLMKLILKLLVPTSGEIYLKGTNIWKLPNKEYYRYVQGVFQDPYSSINPVYRVKHLFNNTSNLLDGMSENKLRQSIRDALELVSLQEDVLDKHIDELSGGQLQRVLLANCLLVNPEIILTDEPTSMIDASLRVIVLNIIRDLSKAHDKLIVFITHDISQAFYICDRILVMYQGKVVEEGPVEEVVLNPKHSYTKRLIADVPKLKQKFDLPTMELRS
ncbi:MAG: dipeptide/oligopeptide/nickel ABC transporter ATP-binding protein [Candidatus Bathyarchaeia archaeon]